MSSTTDWITAIGTAGGAIATVAAVLVALWLARNQNRQIREQAERSQAEKVTAWFIPHGEPQGDENHRQESLRVGNASDQVIYDLIAEVVSAEGHFRETAVGDSQERNSEFGALVGNVPPGGSITWISRPRGGRVRYAIEIAFKDAAGRHWLRHGDGTLECMNKSSVELFGFTHPVIWNRD